ncbi:T. brucei spp.-specific protein [Trypanosoma brucei gambiense DAL972]|uniref:T. brucei spp.-specific protein n=1 Tax=Trypanosoma brucei gambiense (strain MHOM/CI/86/DAL972) TaxID=679716 RepID=D0A359_TRYB9|nr:T. brucei spp.-specific protein [Trypanosoma brucei gambiense DAL972]CBH15703.1 T. brucei spp.-specific protein [Trypanosoma brucei gambiense DAL972]|eukprot:XP_011777967.1 T. brucei spp.-specific protein [Trypanosoma brucei gambiense DAL972]
MHLKECPPASSVGWLRPSLTIYMFGSKSLALSSAVFVLDCFTMGRKQRLLSAVVNVPLTLRLMLYFSTSYKGEEPRLPPSTCVLGSSQGNNFLLLPGAFAESGCTTFFPGREGLMSELQDELWLQLPSRLLILARLDLANFLFAVVGRLPNSGINLFQQRPPSSLAVLPKRCMGMTLVALTTL